ncbi:hypothetical protein SCUCBS95973_009234 [Sporothrix curviconia]|uniref:Uncharacterized protein n=1 Tax=Sporothrix curviconia TaxID=1260050 RepID=A0ABP0CTT9_9PEZI
MSQPVNDEVLGKPEVQPQVQPQVQSQPQMDESEQPVCDDPPAKLKRKTRRGGMQRRKTLKDIHVRRGVLLAAEEEALAELQNVRDEKMALAEVALEAKESERPQNTPDDQAALDAKEHDLKVVLADVRVRIEALDKEYDHVKALSAAARQARLDLNAKQAAEKAAPAPFVLRPTAPRVHHVIPSGPLPPVTYRAPSLRYDPKQHGFVFCNPDSVPAPPSRASRVSKAIPIIDPETMRVKPLDFSQFPPAPPSPEADPAAVAALALLAAFASLKAAPQPTPDSPVPAPEPVPVSPTDSVPDHTPAEPVDAGFVVVEPPTPACLEPPWPGGLIGPQPAHEPADASDAILADRNPFPA